MNHHLNHHMAPPTLFCCADHRKAEQLEEKFQTLQRHEMLIARLDHDSFDALVAEYQAAPSDALVAQLVEMRRLMVAKTNPEVVRRLALVVETQQTQLRENELKPWYNKLKARVLENAEAYLAKIEKEEVERAVAITGKPLPSHIVDEVRENLRRLDNASHLSDSPRRMLARLGCPPPADLEAQDKAKEEKAHRRPAAKAD